MSETLVSECHRETGLPTTIVGPVTVFGPRNYTFTVGLARLLLDGDLPLVAHGRTRAGLIYVDDLTEAMISPLPIPER
jgi:nucleoside-diphosphate-sugar epimerase